MSKKIDKEALAKAGGFTCKHVVQEPMSILKAVEKGTWPKGLPVPDRVFITGYKIYDKTARELARELGTTPRQISLLRSGRIKEAKPLAWYEENNKPKGT